MKKENEDLLLTDDVIDYHIKFVQEHNDYPLEVTVNALCHSISRFQLDKIFNQPWLDEPDSEGWWWYSWKETSGWKLACYQLHLPTACKAEKCRFYYYESGRCLTTSENKGNWQKAIVSEPPKES